MKQFKNAAVKVVTAAAAAAMLAGCLTGCGEAGQESHPAAVSEEAADAGSQESTAAEENSENTGTEATRTADETEAAADTEVYRDFLKGEGTVCWASYVNSADPEVRYYWDDAYKDFFDAEKTYTYDAFVNGILEAESVGEGMTGDAADVQYAMIDLQNSGVPALALQVVMQDQGGTPEYQLFILKDNGNGSLDVAFTRAHGYRTDGYLDPYGFYYEYGRTAGLHGVSAETVDPEGEYRFLYGIEDNTGIYMLTQDEDIMKEAEDAGIAMKILGRHLVLNRTDFSDSNSGYWNYYKLSDDESVVPDESIYEEGSVYSKIWNEIGHERTDDEKLNAIAMQNCIDNGMDETVIEESNVIRTPDTDSSPDEVVWTNVR